MVFRPRSKDLNEYTHKIIARLMCLAPDYAAARPRPYSLSAGPLLRRIPRDLSPLVCWVKDFTTKVESMVFAY